MSTERTIQTAAQSDIITHTILVDQEEILSSIQILSISVSKEVNKIPFAKLILRDGNAAGEDFELAGSDLFEPGKEIEIKAGYRSQNETIFKGLIIKQGIKARRNGQSTLELECRDQAVKLTIGRKNKYFHELTDSDIFEQIIGGHDIDNDVQSTETQYERLVQHYSTDWDYIVSRAEANGQLVMVDDGTIKIAQPDTEQTEAISLQFGATMNSFEVETDLRPQLPALKMKAWDAANQEVVEAEANDTSIIMPGNNNDSLLPSALGIDEIEAEHYGQLKEEELQKWADARLLRGKLAKTMGRTSLTGTAEIKPGQMINLNGISDRFNGNAFVSAVRHDVAHGTWETHVQFGLSDKAFSKKENIIDTKASGLTPAVNGLQIGIVTQLGSDPEGEYRVKVKVPLIDADDEGIWARVSTLDAGEGRGSFFLPEINDEVLIGYLNDDPRYPIILGMLNSSAKPAPVEATDDNHEKGFITRSGIKLVFNDEDKIATIETPNANKLCISDDDGGITLEDENGNKIIMNSEGISIESAADIKLQASGDVTIEGTNISATASAQFTAEGSAGAELSSGGSTAISGGVVQIN